MSGAGKRSAFDFLPHGAAAHRAQLSSMGINGREIASVVRRAHIHSLEARLVRAETSDYGCRLAVVSG